jgi:hypothetical protein
MGEMRNAYEGKRPFGRPRPRWEDNIRMDIGDIGWEVVDWPGRG